MSGNATTDRYVGAEPATRRLARYLATLHRYRASGDAAGQVLYLPLTGVVIVPHRRLPGGWECVVITDPNSGGQSGSPCHVTDLEVEAALPVTVGDPVSDLDADDFVQVWLARAWAHAHGSRPNADRVHGAHLYAMARAIATDLRRPGERRIVWDQPAQRRIALTTRVLPPAQQRLITSLVGQRLLTQTPGGPSGPSVLCLRLPNDTPPNDRLPDDDSSDPGEQR